MSMCTARDLFIKAATFWKAHYIDEEEMNEQMINQGEKNIQDLKGRED